MSTGADIASRLTINISATLNVAPPVTGASYQVLATDNVVLVNHAGATTITLPTTPSANQFLIIKDISGGAQVNNITVIGTVDGVTNPVIGSNYGGVGIVYNGTTWSQIF